MRALENTASPGGHRCCGTLQLKRRMQCTPMQDQSDKSSKTIQSESLRVATTRLDSTENTEPSTSKSLNECGVEPTVPTIDDASSMEYTRQNKTSVVFPFTMIVIRNGLFKFFHIENLENASAEDVMLLAQLRFKMRANVEMLAREANGKADRAVRTVISAMTWGMKRRSRQSTSRAFLNRYEKT